ncbi:MAG: PilZ domain-containing protein [Phycisphaeraceae bacterium]|nr:PilZ domain-containing protein [Phycisphaeraceae bacterium]
MIEAPGADAAGADGSPVSASNRRVKNRINCVLLECEFGEVVNLSMTGMRVRCHRKVVPPPKSIGPMRLTLRLDGRALEVNGRIAWTKRGGPAGLGRWEIGVEFLDADEGLRRELSRLARESSDCEIVRPRG